MPLKIGKIWIVILIIIQSNYVYADKIPPKTVPVQENGQEFRCLSLINFKILLKDYSELRACNKKQNLLEQKIEKLELKIKILENNIELHKDISTNLRKDKERLFKKWKEENNLRHKAEQKPIFGSWIPWILTGVLTTTTTVLGIVVILK